MKKLFFIIRAFALVMIMISCTKKEKLSQSKVTVQKFFSAVKNENSDLMKKYYPKIALFDSYFKSDSALIKSSNFINDSLIRIKVQNHFTNGFGKKSENDIYLFLLPDSVGKYSTIDDSKGLTDHKENKLYSFAVKTGCLKLNDTTDIQILKKFLYAYILSERYKLETLLDFTKNVKITDWSWETGYGGSASGKAIVRNNTGFNIPNIKYEVKYSDRYGSVITTDDGYVTYDKLNAYESTSFTFYTSYVGNAYRASIKLVFDDDIISDYILNSKDYNGTEYEKYLDSSDSLRLE